MASQRAPPPLFTSSAAPSGTPKRRKLMAARGAAFLCMAVAALLRQCALAATITVGGPSGGWDQSTDLQTWATSQTFSTRDTLVFQYLPNHDVLEVSKADYDACQAGTPAKSFGGSTTTTVPLTAPGKRYFICGTAGHCAQGMKLEVDIVSAATAPTPTAPPADAPTLANGPAADGPRAADGPAADPPKAADIPTAEAPSVSKNTTSPPPASQRTQRAGFSAAAGTKASAAAVFSCGLLVLLLAF